MKHIPTYCPEAINGVRAGDILAACDWKELIFCGGTRFKVCHQGRTIRKRGFAEARKYYNSLPYPEVKASK